MLEITFTYLARGDVYLASVITNGNAASVQEILDEDGNVPDDIDWDIITELEQFARCLWMDSQATWHLSGELH